MSAMEMKGAPETVLVLGGDLTVSQAAELKEVLAGAMRGGGPVLLRFGDVGEVDVTFLQLLVAARRAAEARGQRLEPVDGYPPKVLEAAQLAGFSIAWGEEQGG